MAIKTSFEDKFGVIHTDAYINLFDLSLRKGGSVPATVDAGFVIFAGEDQRRSGKEPLTRVSVSIPADEIVALIGKYVYDKLKEKEEYADSKDC